MMHGTINIKYRCVLHVKLKPMCHTWLYRSYVTHIPFLLCPDVCTKTKDSLASWHSTVNELTQGYIGVCSWTLDVRHWSTPHLTYLSKFLKYLHLFDQPKLFVTCITYWPNSPFCLNKSLPIWLTKRLQVSAPKSRSIWFMTGHYPQMPQTSCIRQLRTCTYVNNKKPSGRDGPSFSIISVSFMFAILLCPCNHVNKHIFITHSPLLFYVYGSVRHNIFYEITNRCSYMQSILFHC